MPRELTGSCHHPTMAAEPDTTGGRSAPLQIEAVLDVVLSSACRLLLGESGSIMLLVGTSELEVVCSPANPAALGARVRFGEGVAGKVAATADPVLVSGRAGRRSKPVDSAMSVPLLHGGRIFGVLNINAAEGHAFSDHDLKAATSFGAGAADALAAARLYEVDRRRGVTRPERHLEEMRGHLAAAASIDFVEPRRIVLVDAAKVARDAAAGARSRGRTDVRGPASVPVLADARHLRRALSELIDNGLLHGSAPVTIVFEVGDDLATVTVADGGSGVPPAERARVFAPYVRLRDDHPGLGLGLTIARQLVRALGGELEVAETPVGGAAFRFSLARR